MTKSVITLVLALLCMSCATHKTTTKECSTDTVQRVQESKKDSSTQKVEVRDSVRWITQTRDSVNVFRMIVLTQDENGNVIREKETERTTIMHSQTDSSYFFQTKLLEQERIISELRDSIQRSRQVVYEKEVVEKDPPWIVRFAAGAAPYLLAIVVVMGAYIYIKIR